MVKLGRISYVNMAPVFYRLDAEVEEIQGVPTVVFLDETGQERRELRLVGFEEAADFLKRLEKAP